MRSGQDPGTTPARPGRTRAGAGEAAIPDITGRPVSTPDPTRPPRTRRYERARALGPSHGGLPRTARLRW